jgi:hypothetical protein
MTAPATAPIAPTQNVSASIAPTTSIANDPNQNILDALSAMGGGDDTYRKAMSDMITKMTEQQQSYLTTMKAQPTPEQTYTQYREQLGLPGQEAALTTTQQQIQKTEDLLTSLESDINARSSGMAMTEPLRNRLLATEQTPITKQLQQLSSLAGVQQTGVTSARDQLSNLLQLSQQGQAQQTALAQEPLKFSETMLPIMSQLAQYQTPKEQMAQEIMKQMILQQISPTSTAQAGYETLSPGQTLFDPVTGQVLYKAPEAAGGAEGRAITYQDIGGQKMQIVTDKAGNILSQTPLGLSTTQSQKQADLLYNLAQSKTAYSMLLAGINQMGTTAFGPTARARGEVLKKLEKAGLAHQAETFQSQRDTIKELMAGILSSGGARGLKISIAQIDSALPDIGDSTGEVTNKIINLKTLIKSVEDNINKVYGGDTSTSSGGNIITNEDGTQWQQNADGSYTKIK